MTPSTPTHTLTQVSIMNALLVSKFDGLLPVKELLEHGNHGIGTFNQMDGEMILVDGVIYQGKADGKTYQPDPENLTPFASVCNFVPDMTEELTEPVDYPGLEQAINEMAPNPNVYCAIRVDGQFSRVKTHSLVKQEKPYKPTHEVVKECVQSEMENVSGTIIGFRGTPQMRGLNDTEYHLHFITEDRTRGGHVLEFEMDRGTCAVNFCTNHVMMMPGDGAFLKDVDMSKDIVGDFFAALGAEA